MIFVTTFLVLSVLGIANAGYLYYEHRIKNATLVCPLDHDCSVVTESKWSTLFGIRNELLGLVFYVSIFVAALSPIAIGVEPELINLKTILIFATGFGLLFSVFLTGVQMFAIRDYCFYCLISAGLTLLLFINSFFLNYNAR